MHDRDRNRRTFWALVMMTEFLDLGVKWKSHCCWIPNWTTFSWPPGRGTTTGGGAQLCSVGERRRRGAAELQRRLHSQQERGFLLKPKSSPQFSLWTVALSELDSSSPIFRFPLRVLCVMPFVVIRYVISPKYWLQKQDSSTTQQKLIESQDTSNDIIHLNQWLKL